MNKDAQDAYPFWEREVAHLFSEGVRKTKRSLRLTRTSRSVLRCGSRARECELKQDYLGDKARTVQYSDRDEAQMHGANAPIPAAKHLHEEAVCAHLHEEAVCADLQN